MDDDLLVLKSSHGKIHVMARDNQSVNDQQQTDDPVPNPAHSAAIEQQTL
jgi:hypothetical protein